MLGWGYFPSSSTIKHDACSSSIDPVTAAVARSIPLPQHQLDRSRHCSSSLIDPVTATVARSIPLLQQQLDRSRHCNSSSIDPSLQQ
ncbi:unnamed protein product [Microthlaspi erraticum]|uniref:Uncharacterized protein n=1 Tax=Microthlaspi erraticum TaxID=1685480 RepID=A0A6D2JA90_9BRAS|nr:unnamed protein product [Microthlaspi erraticum]